MRALLALALLAAPLAHAADHELSVESSSLWSLPTPPLLVVVLLVLCLEVLLTSTRFRTVP